MKPFSRNWIIVRATVFLISLTAMAFSAKSQTIETLCFFNGTNGYAGTNGMEPHASLLEATDDSFYGTTTLGGTNNSGTVFRITTNGVLTTLFSFGGSNGISPIAGLAQMDDGSLIGSTAYGGASTNANSGKVGFGTLFKITTNGAFSTLFSFSKTNGAYPAATLLRGSDGNFYGSTERGGAADDGTLFRFSTNGVLTTFFHFTGPNGSYPVGSLVELDGQFYGTTFQGGQGSGTVFKVTTNGTLTTLAALISTNGREPRAGLVLNKQGDFFGTTTRGGSGNYGTVFRITTNGIMTTLVSFDYDNGSEPQGGFVGTEGCFYGTTLNGGLKSASPLVFGFGTVFKVTLEGTFTTLAYLDRTNNGGYLRSGPIQGSDGNLYGTASLGGSNNTGSIYRLTFPQLTFKPEGNKIVFSWPANQVGFRLQSAANLISSSNWIDSTSTPVVTGGRFAITNPIPGNGQQFYRLTK